MHGQCNSVCTWSKARGNRTEISSVDGEIKNGLNQKNFFSLVVTLLFWQFKKGVERELVMYLVPEPGEI